MREAALAEAIQNARVESARERAAADATRRRLDHHGLGAQRATAGEWRAAVERLHAERKLSDRAAGQAHALEANALGEVRVCVCVVACRSRVVAARASPPLVRRRRSTAVAARICLARHSRAFWQTRFTHSKDRRRVGSREPPLAPSSYAIQAQLTTPQRPRRQQ